MFADNPKATLTSSGCLVDTAVCNQIASDLAVEPGKLRDKLDSLRY